MRSDISKGLIFAGALLLAGVLLGDTNSVKEGDLAPDFTLSDQEGVDHTLSDYHGQKVLVYFYPRDDAPGCTKQACALRDDYQEYRDANIVILGISYDPPESHRQFRDKHNLPFILLSDGDKEVAALYGTKGLYPLAIRRSFLIDEEGRLLKIIKDVDITTHSQDVLRYFREAASQL